MTVGSWDGLAVSSVGSGPAVLWLHGYTMRSEVWAPLWDLLPGRRHIGVDLPWHGGSRAGRDDEDLASLADTVVRFALEEGVEHVVALSFGTVLASETAIRHPGAFAGWVLAAPALAGMMHEPAVEGRYRDLSRLYSERGPGPHLTELWMSTPPDIFAGVNRRPGVRHRVRSLVDRHTWREFEAGGMRSLTGGAQHPEALAVVGERLHVITGEADLLTHRACGRSLHLRAGARLHPMPGCGHLPLLEEPAAASRLLERLLLPVSR